MPEGWRCGILRDVANFKRGKTITKAKVKRGTIPVVAGGLKPAYYHNVSNTKAPVITVSGSGANAGFSQLYMTDVFASDCSFVDADATDYIYFVFSFLKDNKNQIISLQKGSAQPHVYPRDLNELEMNIPDEKFLNAFCEEVDPFYKEIKVLREENKIAREARDRLLPKIMSGEIEV